MGLFSTPVVVSENILQLKKITHSDFNFDVKFIDDDNIMNIRHDYYESPCYFKVVSWKVDEKGIPIFQLEYFPKSPNTLARAIINAPIPIVDYLRYSSLRYSK